MKNAFKWLAIYSVAMGYLESAVVVYIRELYYPNGFDFPLIILPNHLVFTEIFREVATMIMLLTIAYIAGDSFKRRFAWFVYCFAIWDIFYYVFLKLLINWPDSIFDWDILFLIPMAWTGPVITPVIASLTMLIMSVLILYYHDQLAAMNLRWIRILILSGAAIIFMSFIWDFSSYMLSKYPVIALFKYDLNQEVLHSYIPDQFNWWIFITGELLVFAGLLQIPIKAQRYMAS